MEREQGRKDATADMSEDLSEGEKEQAPADSMPRVESSITLSGHGPLTPEKTPQEVPERRLYMVLIRSVIVHRHHASVIFWANVVISTTFQGNVY